MSPQRRSQHLIHDFFPLDIPDLVSNDEGAGGGEDVGDKGYSGGELRGVGPLVEDGGDGDDREGGEERNEGRGLREGRRGDGCLDEVRTEGGGIVVEGEADRPVGGDVDAVEIVGRRAVEDEAAEAGEGVSLW